MVEYARCPSVLEEVHQADCITSEERLMKDFDDMTPDEMKRELAMAVGVIRSFIWVHTEAIRDDECIDPNDAYTGRVWSEYLRAMTIADRFKR